MNIGWPQGIFLFLVFMELVKTGFKHGEDSHPLYAKHNIGVKIFDLGVLLGLMLW